MTDYENYARSISTPNHHDLNNDQQPSGPQQASSTFDYFLGREPQEASALETHNDQGTCDDHRSMQMHPPVREDSRSRKPSVTMEDLQTDNLGVDHSVSSSRDINIAHNDLSCEPRNVIDIDENFMASVCNKIPAISDGVLKQTIYRVPDEIRSLDEMAYTPRVVCIGPLFDPARTNTTNLKQMEDYKWSCLSKLISKGNVPNNPDILNRDLLLKCFTEMKKLDTRIRDSYPANIDISDNELALMMVLDGCFILHLLHAEEDDMKVIGRCCIWNLVAYDLLLLENQIPFFVIQALFDLIKNGNESNEPDDLIACGLGFFCSIHLCRTYAFSFIRSSTVHHLLHLVYLSIIPPFESKQSHKNAHEALHLIPSAKELEYSGVKIKRKISRSFLLDIKFRKGVMEIPPLEVYDYSNSLFRNLIAFEQCYPDTRCDITLYAVFMDRLLNTTEDARLLHMYGILINRRTSGQDAAHFFSRLCNQVHYAFDRSYLRELFVDVNKYHESRWHKLREALVRNYVTNPWAAATVLLLLTAAQSFFAVYSYFKPPK